MSTVFAADAFGATHRNERAGVLVGLAVSCGIHGVALAMALTFLAEHEAIPPAATRPTPLVARMMMQETATASEPVAAREPAVAPAVPSQAKPERVRKTVAPMPTAAEAARPVVQEAPAPRADSEPARAEPTAQQASVVASAAPKADASAVSGEPVVPPSFNADYLDNPAPVYPPAARRLREQGRVLLLVDVAPDGVPRQVNLATSSGSPRLDEAALDAVRRWRFVPARKGTTAVPAQVLVPIVFGLTS